MKGYKATATLTAVGETEDDAYEALGDNAFALFQEITSGSGEPMCVDVEEIELTLDGEEI